MRDIVDSRVFSRLYPAIAALRNSLRRLKRVRAYAVATIATVALGIGVNAAVFFLADAWLFQSGSFTGIDRIVVLEKASGTYIGERSSRPAPDLLDWQDGKIFESVASFAPGAANLLIRDAAERVAVTLVTPDFFAVLGATTADGRRFLPEEGKPHQANVAIVSDKIRRRYFSAAASVIGSPIQLNGKTFEIVGVMSPSFGFPSQTDIWIPLTLPFDPSQMQLMRTALLETIVGRLQRGVTAQRAQTAVDVIVARVMAKDASNSEEFQVRVTSFRSHFSRGNASEVALLMSMALLLLLIATANVVNLSLVRSSSRLDEVKLRIALGATTAHIRAQLLVEPFILSVLGGLAGLLAANWTIRWMVTHAVLTLGELGQVRVGVLSCSVALGLSLLIAGIACVTSSTILLTQAVGPPDSSRLGLSGVGSKTRKYILAGQVAVSFVLLVETALVIQSLARLLDENDNLAASALTAEIALSPTAYSNVTMRETFVDEFLNRVRSISGVQSAGIVSSLPLGGGSEVTIPVRINGTSQTDAQTEGIEVEQQLVSPGYFRAMNIDLIRGRDFVDADGPGAPLVAVISKNMAKRYWADSDPLGATISLAGDPHPRTIVGVVEAVRSVSLSRQPVPQLYFPYAQDPTTYFAIVARVSGNDESIAGSIRSVTHSLDSTVPIFKVRTFGQLRQDSVAPERSRALLLAAFGFLAIALSAIGVYGAASFIVMQRSTEIGIRRALGAPGDSVVSLIIDETLRPVISGLLIGVFISLGIGGLTRNLLYGIGANDPMSSLMVGFGLLLVALMAMAIPASRAIRIDPMRAIRAD